MHRKMFLFSTKEAVPEIIKVPPIQMANGAIESRLISSLHNPRSSKNGHSSDLDLHQKLKIQQKQNSLPTVKFTPPTLEIATDIEQLKSKYIVLTPKECGPKLIFGAFPFFAIGRGGISSGYNWPV